MASVDPFVVTLSGVAFAGFMSWVAYVTKQLVEHAKWMAVAHLRIERLEESGAQGVTRPPLEPR